MSSQRYERVSVNDQDDAPMTPATTTTPHDVSTTPSSPPPSFRSRTSSPSSRHLLASQDPSTSDAERTLHDTFDDGSDSEDDNSEDDRQRLIRSNTNPAGGKEQRNTGDNNRPALPRTVTTLPPPTTPAALGAALNVPTRRPASFNQSQNDGVFANLDAKPEIGEKLEELPPSYEAAAADATPPYWETTILAPGHLGAASDEVYVDGLPVGSLFSFIWNAMISMSFSLVGFLLTYLLHTTHAAKNGSRAGLGVTLVQYGFYMRAGRGDSTTPSVPTDGNDSPFTPPMDPNNHDFDPGSVSDSAAAAAAAAMAQGTSQAATSAGGGLSSVASSNWLAYTLMIVGWFILIRSVSDFVKARRHEQLVLQSPERGLNVPVVADNERPETVV